MDEVQDVSEWWGKFQQRPTLMDNNSSKVYAGEHMNRLHKSQSSYIYSTETP